MGGDVPDLAVAFQMGGDVFDPAAAVQMGGDVFDPAVARSDQLLWELSGADQRNRVLYEFVSSRTTEPDSGSGHILTNVGF